MAARREIVGINFPIKAVLDKGSTVQFIKDVRDLEKKAKPLNVSFSQLAKHSHATIGEIKDISKAAEQFTKKLGSAAKVSLKQLQELGDELEDAQALASKLAKKASKAKDPGEKDALTEEFQKQAQKVANLNKAIDDQRKTGYKFNRQLKDIIKAQESYHQKLEQAASFSPKEAMFGVLKGLGKAITGGKGGFLSGLKDAASSAGSGIQGVAARKGMEAAAGEGGAAGAQIAAGMGAAVASVGAMAAAIGVLIKVIMMASDHMTELNKALLKGSTLAGDMGMSAADYTKTVRAMSKAAQDSAGSLLAFGMNSEKTLDVVAAFNKEASGSIAKTEVMLEQLGSGDLKTGMATLARNSQIYGKALGMEATDVASMMGNMMTEIGYSHKGVMGVMDQIVKTAASANIPVHKFMDIFKDALPNIDLFTNRIEELTGMVKLLNKTMSPKDMKSFMQTLSKGFDQLDFKQRLKMALVIGPGKVANILRKDFQRTGDSIGKDLPESIRNAMDAALKDRDPMKVMAGVAAKAVAAGIEPAKIGAMQKLARSQASLNKGGVLDLATSMKGAGAYARMDMLESLSQSLTGSKDVSGIGEAVANKLGVSEDQLKAIQGLQNNIMMWKEQIAKSGRTSSKAINQGLMKAFAINRKKPDGTEKSVDEMNKELGSKLDKASSEEVTDALKQAGAAQIDEDKSAAESMEDLTTDSINAQMSISDKLESIVGFYLEKIYGVLQPILDTLDGLFKYVVSDGSASAKAQATEAKRMDDFRNDGLKNGAINQKAYAQGQKYTKEQTQQLSAMLGAIQTGAHAGSRADYVKSVEPMIDKIGDMNLDQFDKMSKTFGGFFKRGGGNDLETDKYVRGKLEEIAAAKSPEEKESLKQKLAADMKDFFTTHGDVKDTDVDQGLARLAGALAGSSAQVGTGGGADLYAQQSQTKLTKEQRDAMDLAKTNADYDAGAGEAILGSKDFNALGLGQSAQAQAGADAAAAGGKPPPGAATVPGAAAAGVAPVRMGTTTMGSPVAPKTHEKMLEELQDSGKSQDEIASAVDQDYENTGNMLELLKKGLKFEESWMRTKLKRILKEASLESFRTALAEFAVIEAKMSDDGFKSALKDNADDIVKKGITLDKLASVTDADGVKKLIEDSAPHMATGGPVLGDGLHYLHQGETVVPKGSGGGTLILNFNGSGITADEAQRIAYNAVDRMKRAP